MSIHQPPPYCRSVSLWGRSGDHTGAEPKRNTHHRQSSHNSNTAVKSGSLRVSRPVKMSIVVPPPRAHVRRSDDITTPTSSFRRPIPSPVPPSSPVIYPSPDSPPQVIRTLVQGQPPHGHVQHRLRPVSSAIDLRQVNPPRNPVTPLRQNQHGPHSSRGSAARHRAEYTPSHQRVLAASRHSSKLSPPSSHNLSPHGSPSAVRPRRLSSSSVTAVPPESNQDRSNSQHTAATASTVTHSHDSQSNVSRPSSAQFYAPPRPTHHHHRLQSESMIPGYSATPNGDFVEHPDPPQFQYHTYQHATYPGAELPCPAPTPPPLGSALQRNNTTPRAFRDSNFSDVASTIAPMGQRSSVLTAGRSGTDGEWITQTAHSGSPSVPLDKLPEDWRQAFIPVLVSKQARENLRAALNVFLDEPHVRENYAVELFVHKDDTTVLFVCHRGTRRELVVSDIKKTRHQLAQGPKGRQKVGRPRANTGASTMSFMVTDDFMPQPIPRACCSQTTHRSLDVLLVDSDAAKSDLASLIHLVPRPISMPLATQVDKDTKQYLIASFILRPDLHAVCYPTNAPVFLDHEAAPSPLLIPGQLHQTMPVGCTFAPKARDLQVWLRVAVQSMVQNGTWGRIPVDDQEEMNNVCCTIM